ncbi:MAG: aldolase/citrate lyase family protein [Alphaproteobacteria bacterium]|nr:aldolase/citrate lyase family protein [Alphaproteobacteria bacterium]
MIKNRLKRLWADGVPTFNSWLTIPSAFSAEIMAEQGFDSLTLDLQHGVLHYDTAVPMLQAMRASGVVPLARVPWREPGIIMKMLDAGVYGVICPMVNSRAEAEEFVSYMRYPPLGTRSFGPTRAAISGGAGYAAEANGEVLAIAMIETAPAMRNLQEIVTTPGLDGVYIGPADLTLGITEGRLGPGFDREEPEVVEAIQTILAAAKGAGIRSGLHCGSPEYGAKAIGWGFNFVTVSGDGRYLAAGAGAARERIAGLTGRDGGKSREQSY